jgi:hypothetical protein
MTDLDHNYTEEVRAFYEDRLHKLGHYARQWPIRVAFSKTRDQTAIGGPEAGTRQCHLLCWLEKEDGVTHCGQAVYILAVGPKLYTVRPDGITQSIQSHIMQCHSEVVKHAD